MIVIFIYSGCTIHICMGKRGTFCVVSSILSIFSIRRKKLKQVTFYDLLGNERVTVRKTILVKLICNREKLKICLKWPFWVMGILWKCFIRWQPFQSDHFWVACRVYLCSYRVDSLHPHFVYLAKTFNRWTRACIFLWLSNTRDVAFLWKYLIS